MMEGIGLGGEDWKEFSHAQASGAWRIYCLALTSTYKGETARSTTLSHAGHRSSDVHRLMRSCDVGSSLFLHRSLLLQGSPAENTMSKSITVALPGNALTETLARIPLMCSCQLWMVILVFCFCPTHLLKRCSKLNI